jgi:hypothetical protein
MVKKNMLMKKITMLAAVMILVSANLNAQKKVNVDYAVTKTFEREFKDASRIRWSALNHNIFMARFNNQQDRCIAYFTSEGEMILTGRKIAFEILPIMVKKGAEEVRTMNETQSGELTIREIYELAGDRGTEYFMNLTGKNLLLSVIVYGNGTSKVLKRSKWSSENEGTSILAERL